ncbi:MAG: hypothetical protein HS111_02005 [Kofleriaceae bacterium]|nr:hypothetical protein [Kofleriaceae bacterium]
MRAILTGADALVARPHGACHRARGSAGLAARVASSSHPGRISDSVRISATPGVRIAHARWRDGCNGDRA